MSLAVIWSLQQRTNSVVVKVQIVHCNISMSIVNKQVIACFVNTLPLLAITEYDSTPYVGMALKKWFPINVYKMTCSELFYRCSLGLI